MVKRKHQKSEFFEIDKLLDKKIIDKKVWYLVQWKNYSEDDNSWSEAKDVTQDAIDEFEEKVQTKIKRVRKLKNVEIFDFFFISILFCFS